MTLLPVIFNPAARGGRGRPPREALERVATRHGVRLEWRETAAPGHATELAARAARDGALAVAVWGGDGTYNEAARGLLGSETALLALPGGTTSVLGYELAIPRDPVPALEALLTGSRRSMAVGRTDRGQIVLLMLSAGPEARILAGVPDGLKRRFGKVGIGIESARVLLAGRLPRFVANIDGDRLEVGWCIVGNGRCYGGTWRATPGADPFASGFEVVTLAGSTRLAAVRFFGGIVTGRHLARPGVARWAAQRVELTGPEGVAYQIDGDYAGNLPIRVEPAAEALVVALPAAAAPAGI